MIDFRKKGISSEKKQGEIGNIFKKSIGSTLQKYQNMSVIRITRDYHLLPDDRVKHEVDLTFLYSGSDNLMEFDWHHPFITKNTKIIGVRVSTNEQVTGLESKREDKYHLIRINLNSVEPNTYVHLQFEFFATGVSYHKKGLLWDTIRYPFAFLPAPTVESLDLRFHVPGKKEPIGDINIDEFVPVKLDEGYLLLTSEEENLVGDINGSVTVTYKNSTYQAFISVVLGILVSLLFFILPDFRSSLGSFWYLLILCSSLLIILLTYKLFEE